MLVHENRLANVHINQFCDVAGRDTLKVRYPWQAGWALQPLMVLLRC